MLKQGLVVRVDDLKGNAGFAAFLQRGAYLFGVADEDGFDEASRISLAAAETTRRSSPSE